MTAHAADARDYPFGRARETFTLHWHPGALRRVAARILAYGANASPERLAEKLPGVPVLAVAGRLRGFAVVHSAHVSPYGAVPATLVDAPGEATTVHALHLPPDALDALDTTEPNYDRVELPAACLELPDDVPAAGGASVQAYVSKHGPLLVGGEPIPLGSRPQDELRALVEARSRP